MRLVTFSADGVERLGALVEGGVLDLAAAGVRTGRPIAGTMQQLIEAGSEAWDSARAIIEEHPDEDVVVGARLLCPLPRPVRLRDASLMLDHMEAALRKIGKTMPDEFRRQVIYYNADHIHMFGPEDDIPWPARSQWIDYELEWACVIGRDAVDVRHEEARDLIFGLTVFNDWSARDLQLAFMEAGVGPGGGKDFANSLGPCIATLDEFENIYDLTMTARVNGELWSQGKTDNMFHSWEDAIVQLSAGRSLVAGEVIGSGTVLNGCGLELGRKPAIGDIIELEVEGVGILANRVVAARELREH